MSGLGGKGVTGRRRKARQSPSGLAGSASSPVRGAFLRAAPARIASLVKGRCRAQARRRDSWPSAGVTGGHARPVGILQASQARPAPLKGEPFARAKPAREASPSGEVAAEQAGRVQPVDGGHNKVAGRACPAPTDCRESSCTRGAREGGSPPLPSWRVGDRKRAATQGPSESPSPLTRPAPFDKGASTSPLRGFGGTPEF